MWWAGRPRDVRDRREAGGAIANEQHLWSTPVSHLSRRSGSIKGERRSGWSREEQACVLVDGLFLFVLCLSVASSRPRGAAGRYCLCFILEASSRPRGAAGGFIYFNKCLNVRRFPPPSSLNYKHYYTHQGCIYLIKNSVKTVILWNTTI